MAALFVIVLLVAAPAGAQDVGDRLDAAVGRIEAVVARWFVRSLPIVAASSGVQFAFDPATGTFAREPAVHGQLYLERAQPLGRGRWNVRVGWERFELASVGGESLEDTSDLLPIRVAPGRAGAVRIPAFSATATAHQATAAVTYGLTDDVDLTLAVPFVHSDIAAAVTAEAAAITTAGSLRALRLTARDGDVETGIGDVLVAAKARVLAAESLHAAAGLALRFPTGDEDHLHGAGVWEVVPALYASSRRYEVHRWARLQAHANLGLRLDAEDASGTVGQWGAGLDWGVGDDVTLGAAILGRHPFARLAPPGFFAFTRCPSFARCLTSARDVGTRPLFGLSGARPDYWDATFGGRVNLWRDTIIGFASVVVPLNDAGVRTEPIPLAGIEAAF
jgi:hypothetical protein